MRSDCKHYESRTYGGGETARKCQLDLAPEAPWRCPADCAHYESGANDGTFETGGLEHVAVEDEPTGESPEAIADLLDDAEGIVDEAEPEVLRDIGAAERRR